MQTSRLGKWGTGEYLQKLHTYSDQPVRDWLVSVKLDGMMAFWDGGVSRGKPAAECSWANTWKDDRLVDPVVCTGLWSRLGKVIKAPDWWLDAMPDLCMIGELYIPPIGAGPAVQRQDLISIIKGGGNWDQVVFNVTERVPTTVFNMNRSIRLGKGVYWDMAPDLTSTFDRSGLGVFVSDYEVMSEMCLGRVCKVTPQTRVADLAAYLEQVLSRGGEGLVVRDPMGRYVNKRSGSVLKLKGEHDTEAVVIGYEDGRADRGYAGMVGSLRVRGVEGDLLDRVWSVSSGLDLVDRDAPPAVGTVVSLRYRCLTVAGLPQECRYVGLYSGDLNFKGQV